MRQYLLRLSFIRFMAIGYPLFCHPDEGGISVFKFRYFFNVLDPSFVGMTGERSTNCYFSRMTDSPLQCHPSPAYGGEGSIFVIF